MALGFNAQLPVRTESVYMKKLIPILLALLALTGCDGEARTTVDVSGPGSASVAVSLSLVGEARAAVLNDSALDQRLLTFVAERSGGVTDRSDEDGVLDYSAVITKRELPGTLTGVSAIAAGGSDDALVSTIRLVEPTDLRAAIEAATAGQPDSGAMSLAWQKSMKLTLVVDLPGDVESVKGIDSSFLTVDGSRVTVSSSMETWPTGDLIVTSGPAGHIFFYAIGAVIILALLGLLFLRRRR